MAITNDKGLLRIGRGKFFAKRLDDSVGLDQGEGFAFAHQVTSIVYTPNEDKLEENDATSAVGGTLASITVGRKPTIKITDKSFLSDFLAFALMGSKNILTQAATAVTTEVHANVKQGTYVFTDKIGPVTSLVVTPAGGGTAFVLDTDYSVEDLTGFAPAIYIIPGGGIADGDGLNFAYTPTAYTSVEQVAGATKSEINVALKFIGSASYGPRYNFEVWKASVNIDAALEFIQSQTEFGSFDLTFTLLDDSSNHPDVPFIDLRRVDNAATA